MIDPEVFVENMPVTVTYFFGGAIREDYGIWRTFGSELEYEPYTRFDGIILEPAFAPVGEFPTSIWIPYDNVLAVTYGSHD